MYRSLADAVRDANARGMPLSQLALETESEDQGRPVSEIRDVLRRALVVMQGAVDAGARGRICGRRPVSSAATPPSWCPGRPGRWRIRRSATFWRARSPCRRSTPPWASSSPRRRPAAPACCPAVLTGLAAANGFSDDQLVDALATAGLIGAVVAERASLSGAEGGCQAETGAAAGMAAGAGTEMMGGSPDQVSHAVALAQQGTLGLVCDPLGGLVELPCVFRNATGAAIALAAIEMAMAGITFAIPADEVIDTMGEIGREMDVRYRETAGGGLAATPTGRRLARERLVQIKRS